MSRPRKLKSEYRGVIQMLIRFGAPTEKFFRARPESIAMLVGVFLSGSSYLGLNPLQLRTLRRYIKKHNLEDWTRRPDEPGERDSTATSARRRKNNRKL